MKPDADDPMPTFADRLRATWAMLDRPLGPSDGTPEAIIAAAEARLGITVPAVLRTYYLLTGRDRRFNQAHDQLVDPSDWSIVAGKLTFAVENQGVVYWGVGVGPASGDDPPVYQAQGSSGEETDWFEEHALCSEFLLVMLTLQAIWGGCPVGAVSGAFEDEPEHRMAGWMLVGKVQEVRAFVREGGAACAFRGDESWWLEVGARSPKELRVMADDLAATGIRIDPRDLSYRITGEAGVW